VADCELSLASNGRNAIRTLGKEPFPSPAADLIAYYGPEDSFDLAKWGVEKGGELAKKALGLAEKVGGPFAKLAGGVWDAVF
jgi:hypothetical protein